MQYEIKQIVELHLILSEEEAFKIKNFLANPLKICSPDEETLEISKMRQALFENMEYLLEA